ncbi:hypothetical protein CBR_g49934 [Chara braunii]|uniref:FAS1 domain-containing protein n=1 Tax=Chara braunii TaxID=69332 RepID=A0A388JPC2_CHABU|nr:hypothetical protein CBR_g49934 [Chara braunii]|eukprot:GBG59669.1 hypothetical protein CBR_g49934 [Chara braunii]
MKELRGRLGRAVVFLSLAVFVAAQVAPPYVPPVYAGQKLLDAIAKRGELSFFYGALVASRIDLTLVENVDRQPVTVFAPNNAAFQALDPELQACLQSEKGKLNILTQILTFHIAVGRNFTVDELKSVKELPTVMGMALDLEVALGGKILIEKTATIVGPNALSSYNATVHIIDDVMIPGNLVGNILTGCYGVPASSSLPMPSAGSF